ncbi:uncharacterized protein RCO7_08677 [Rhynchosporium graminicola]|uniref:Zn(2)-C6 fungal-type domain-containing protein n=1 Tax=Rhynchosporium graminicola TaxID=2792576 RepID=A0A1E1LPE0_9HELO|nr:uncharacterized protein RCO7_08677 [Rhynchosporium commune]
MNSESSSAGGLLFRPEANTNKQAKNAKNDPPSHPRQYTACQACKKSKVKCDFTQKNPCTKCEKTGRDCIPFQPGNQIPAPTKPNANQLASGPNLGSFALPASRAFAPQKQFSSGLTLGQFALPNPQPSFTPYQPPPPPKMSGAPRRTPAEQAIFDDRNRFDNSDSSDDERPAPSEHSIELSLRGDRAAEEMRVELSSVVLPDSTGGPDAPVIPSTSTLLTDVQLAAQGAPGGSKKKRRRPKKKTSKAAGTTDEPSAPTPSSSVPSTSASSFQAVTIEDEDEDITTPAPTPPHDSELDIEKHYQDQPFLLCCPYISITSPLHNTSEEDLLSLSQRIAGMIPDHLIIGPKNAYGVVWCDFPIIFGLAYIHKPTKTRGINWYGTTSWLSGEINEILVQGPAVETCRAAPSIEKECLIRQPACVDFACSQHLDHTFSLYEVQWQAQGEGRRREAIRKICKATGEDFASFLRADRIEKQHMHL